MTPNKIAILGLGLIGGSLGLALKAKAKRPIQIVGYDLQSEACQKALELGAIDETSGSYEGLASCEVVFLCAPVLQIRSLADQIKPFVKPGMIITDVGSTKQNLQTHLAEYFPEGVHFVGGHPMAGREMSGMSAAQPDLFAGKWYIIIREPQTNEAAIKKVTELITWTGAHITYMDALKHDRYAAVISHLPHVASAALVNMLDHYDDADAMIKLAGGGFRDTTRIASSNADMWSDICLTNQAALIDCIKKYQLLLGELIQHIEAADRAAIHQYFRQAKIRRDGMIDQVNN